MRRIVTTQLFAAPRKVTKRLLMNMPAKLTKGERTRAHIVASAATMFWRKSFNGVSVDDIAAEAQVNKATIYRYFADKADLALAVTRHQGVLTLNHIFDASFAEHGAPDARLASIYAKAHFVHVQTMKEEGDITNNRDELFANGSSSFSSLQSPATVALASQLNGQQQENEEK